MRIAFVADEDCGSVFGGYIIQRDKTREALHALGHHVDLVTTNSGLESVSYDVLHLWTSDAEKIRTCSRLMVPKVATVVYVSRKYRDLLTIALHGRIRLWVGRGRELLGRARSVMLQRLPRETNETRWRYLLRNSDLFLVLAEGEATAIRQELGVMLPHHLAFNGVDASSSPFNPDCFAGPYGKKDFVVCVGRFEPLKNQLGLIEALAETSLKLLLVGRPHPHHPDYFERCKAHFGDRVAHIPHIPHSDIGNVYAAAKVCAQPSFYEAASLAVLEAGLAGSNVVTTDRSYHREYFGDLVSYCEPSGCGSIRNAVQAAFDAPVRDDLRTHIASRYTWHNTAKCTVEAYERVLSLNRGTEHSGI